MDAPPPCDVRKYVALYRSRGYQALPSDPRPHEAGGRKKPLVRFADLWERTAGEDLFARFPSCNVQVMLGRYWGLCVLDLDGPDAVAWFEARDARPKTWVSSHGRGDRSRHVWFRTPPGDRPRPKRVLWRGDGEHSAAEMLCDRSLIMAPPSLHPKTRRAYAFLPGLSPAHLSYPAVCPPWLWTMPPAEPAGVPVGTELTPAFVQPRASSPSSGPSAADVLSVVPAADVARGWGLRFARGRANADGWHPVHDFDRPDHNPSAAFNVRTGRFWRPGGFGPRRTMSLFDLGVAMGHFADWRECCLSLAEYYGPASPGAPHR